MFNFFYGLSDYWIIRTAALLLSYPIAYSIFILLIVWALFFSERKMYTFSLLFLSGIFAWLTSNTLKFVFHTTRPFLQQGIVPLHAETGFSFPSSHAAVFAALAVALWVINKRAGVVFSIIAIFIGISRIVIGVHYPIDVIGGLLLGSLIGYLFIRLFKKV